MKLLHTAFAACAALVLTVSAEPEEGFVSLFDGKTLDGWKVGGNAAAFKVVDGAWNRDAMARTAVEDGIVLGLHLFNRLYEDLHTMPDDGL